MPPGNKHAAALARRVVLTPGGRRSFQRIIKTRRGECHVWEDDNIRLMLLFTREAHRDTFRRCKVFSEGYRVAMKGTRSTDEGDDHTTYYIDWEDGEPPSDEILTMLHLRL